MIVKKTHVLLVAFAFQGHMNPMLRFAKHISRPNLHITIATTEKSRDVLSAAITADELCSLVDLVFFSDGLTEDDPRAEESLIKSLRIVGKKNLSKIVEGNRFSCVVSVPFATWIPLVAASYEIPCALLWIEACGVLSIYYSYYMKTNSFTYDLEDMNQTVKLPALPLLEVRDLPSFLLPSIGAHFNTLMVEFIDCLKDVKWILVNSFYELGHNRIYFLKNQVQRGDSS